MLKWVRDLIAPIRKMDPVFGELRYQSAAGFWEGCCTFRPLGRDVEVLVSCGSEGPTEEQRGFFRALEEKYQDLWNGVERAVNDERERVGAPSSAAMELVCIDVPEDGGTEFELSYELVPPSWHFTVTCRRWAPVKVQSEQ